MRPFDEAAVKALRAYEQKIQNEASKAAGILEERMKTLETEFGCTSLEEADNALAVLKKRQEKAVAAYEKECELFEKEWGELLDELVGKSS
jgi:hypothetical protein